MIDIEEASDLSIKNANSPFTELFSIFSKYLFCNVSTLQLVCSTKEISIMHQHLDNAIGIVLQGQQDIGSLISLVEKCKSRLPGDLNGIGYLISGMSNLTEALYMLKSDADFVLRQRGKIDY